MQLAQFVENITSNFEQNEIMERRSASAKLIAAKYKFDFPNIILFFTHPDMVQKTFSERCKLLKMTEEEYMIACSQPGFKRFVKDFKDLCVTNLQTQAFEKLALAIEQKRFRYDKNGNASEEFDIEVELAGLAVAKPASVQVNNTNNNIQISDSWTRARERAKERTLQQTNGSNIVLEGEVIDVNMKKE